MRSPATPASGASTSSGSAGLRASSRPCRISPVTLNSSQSGTPAATSPLACEGIGYSSVCPFRVTGNRWYAR
ncbi:hypothetical protein [Crossiella sp. CA198]|uniref:hypothetical protein n=1 Tax=Crossiella sp. CA198 TaxID=3455607 RepID=UPI003F8D3D70